VQQLLDAQDRRLARERADRAAGITPPPLHSSQEQMLLDEQSRRLERERAEPAAGTGSHLDTASIETAQQAAQVGSSALRFISGIFGRGLR
jgi:hypothetical protein